MKYAELHCRSYFSFLAGASPPEELIERAQELGYVALAITDVDGVHGAARAHAAIKRMPPTPTLPPPGGGREKEVEGQIALGVGSEVTVEDDLAPAGPVDPEAPTAHLPRLVLLAQDARGYANLCRLVTEGRRRWRKGSSSVRWDELAGAAGGLVALSGGGGGPVDRALRRRDRPAALRWAARLREAFGARAFVELTHHLAPGDDARLRELGQLARTLRMPALVAQDARYARPAARALYDVQTCIRTHTTLREAGRRLAGNGERYLLPPAELAARFAACPDALARTAEVAASLRFSLDELRYRFPACEVPGGETPFSYLHHLTHLGARARYRPLHPRAAAQIARELAVIEKLDLAGYFLIVWDIVRFARERGILCQGRGSAANSAVCYALGITAVDPVGMDLLFERFLSEERDEMPDIDLDIASDRREEVIQYVYQRFGRERTAMTCTVITYHARSAVRDVGAAFGLSPAQIDRAAKALDRHLPDWSPQGVATNLHAYCGVPDGPAAAVLSGLDPADPTVRHVMTIARAFEGFPRHLGIHSGGMVITAGPTHEVVPVENATMVDRTVVQWDKDDLNGLGIIKIDLLGLGMLTAIAKAIALIERCEGVTIDLARLPPDDPAVYDMICRADTIGVFQIESRAQMNMLPRLRPRCFYDLVIEVAIIRPGPIQGDMIHPFLRRRNRLDPVTYDHPSLEPVLARTLGVPLFQEQGMKLAIAAAGFTAAQADELRRAMGHKRSHQRMAALERRLLDGMAANGIPEAAAQRIFHHLKAFADYGFPESHAASFALLVYASCYLKHYHPAAFTAALLSSQPMGFYAPNTLVADARRHGVTVLPPCARRSEWEATLEGARAVRLGLLSVHGLADGHRAPFERERARAPFSSLGDFARRSGLPRAVLERLAAADGFAGFGLGRREALWQVAALPAGPPASLPGLDGEPPSAAAEGVSLPRMSQRDALVADYIGLGLSIEHHPLALARQGLAAAGIRSAANIARAGQGGERVRVAGMVIVRQRPGPAKGILFITLEDETGLVNLVIMPPVFERFRVVAREAPLVIAGGLLERSGLVVNLKVDHLERLSVPGGTAVTESRDFR